jgi:DNA-binding transcriptional MerR regulator
VVSAYLTTAEVAEICRTSSETLRYWRHIGKGPSSFKLGRRVLYDPDDLQSWIAEQRESQQGGTPDAA